MSDADKQMSDLKAEVAAIDQELAMAAPVKAVATNALSTIKKSEIQELAMYSAPPAAVGQTMAAVLHVLGEQDSSWGHCKVVMKKSDFLHNLTDLSKLNLSDEGSLKLKADVEALPAPEEARRTSAACGCFVQWLRAVSDYDNVAKALRPKETKRQELVALIKQLESGGEAASEGQPTQETDKVENVATAGNEEAAPTPAQQQGEDQQQSTGQADHWDVAVNAISKVPENDLKEILAFAQPPKQVQGVMDAFYHLCGFEDGFSGASRTAMVENGLAFGGFPAIAHQGIHAGGRKAEVNQFVNVTLPQLKKEFKLEDTDQYSRVAGLVAGFLLIVPQYCAEQIEAADAGSPAAATQEEAVAPAQEQTATSSPAEEPPAQEEATTTAATAEPTVGGEEHQQQEETDASKEQVTSDDVAWEYEDHYFTRADVVDVTKIQATYRRKAARRKVEDAKEHQRRLKEEEAERRKRRVNRIELPDDSEIAAPETTAAATAAAEEKKKESANGKARAGFVVDYSKPLNRKDMSADTQGMQRMYSRMLKTKMWW